MEILNFDGVYPKRGDLCQSNVGRSKERTWLILWARRRKQRPRSTPRVDYARARWWELEPEMRNALYRSAQRNGGQRVWFLESLPKKRRPTFEQFMRRKSLGDFLP